MSALIRCVCNPLVAIFYFRQRRRRAHSHSRHQLARRLVVLVERSRCFEQVRGEQLPPAEGLPEAALESSSQRGPRDALWFKSNWRREKHLQLACYPAR